MHVTIYLYRPSGEESFVIDTEKLGAQRTTIEDAVNRQAAFVELSADAVRVELLRAKSVGITGLVLDVHQVS